MLAPGGASTSQIAEDLESAGLSGGPLQYHGEFFLIHLAQEMADMLATAMGFARRCVIALLILAFCWAFLWFFHWIVRWYIHHLSISSGLRWVFGSIVCIAIGVGLRAMWRDAAEEVSAGSMR